MVQAANLEKVLKEDAKALRDDLKNAGNAVVTKISKQSMCSAFQALLTRDREQKHAGQKGCRQRNDDRDGDGHGDDELGPGLRLGLDDDRDEDDDKDEVRSMHRIAAAYPDIGGIVFEVDVRTGAVFGVSVDKGQRFAKITALDEEAILVKEGTEMSRASFAQLLPSERPS